MQQLLGDSNIRKNILIFPATHTFSPRRMPDSSTQLSVEFPPDSRKSTSFSQSWVIHEHVRSLPVLLRFNFFSVAAFIFKLTRSLIIEH